MNDVASAQVNPTLFSIGHSNHGMPRLIELLEQHQIDVIADVRTSPYSKYSPQFTREPLTKELLTHGIRYVFLGKELGGRPNGAAFYDQEGHVRYDRLANSEIFQGGLTRLLEGCASHRVAMLCSEGDPAQCHRHLLIGRVLAERGIKIIHIEPNGGTSSYSAVAERTPIQRSLFAGEEESQWRSPLSVLQSTAPNHSSDD